MKASEIIYAYRNATQFGQLLELEQSFSFSPQRQGDVDHDANLAFRTELTEALLHDFSLLDRSLILSLFRAEIDCEIAIWRHDNLYQLSFYLYSLGQLEDCFILYEAKYGVKHMDSSSMQDHYSITVGHEPSEVINYVLKRFKLEPTLQEQYPELIDVLRSIEDEPDYDSIEDYTQFIRGYFYSNEIINHEPIIHVSTKAKKWWQFWQTS